MIYKNHPLMPTISVTKNEIETLLNANLNPIDFSNLLFDFGLEVDEIIENGPEISYKIEIPANRYDLLCAEGLNHALSSYMNNIIYEDYTLKTSNYRIVKKTNYRGCIASAIIKNLKFTKESYKSFISYQEKLSDSLGKNRSIVSIGTHNLDEIQFPVIFKNIEKKELNFKPLNSSTEISDLYEYFKNDKKMLKYLSYTDKDNYTVFIDSKDDILSVPPVINSDLTKITLDTKNVFVEVTGINQHKVNVCLKMLLSAFKSNDMYEVIILNEDGKMEENFDEDYIIEISCQEVYNELNINLNINELSKLLIRMMYKTEIISENKLKIKIPLVRQDVIHKCDIIEDIAISYGYNNIKKVLPDVNTIGKKNNLNKYSDKIRLEMTILGFIEVYTLILTSKTDGKILVDNYKSSECEEVRSSLIGGLIKSVSSNLHCKIPIKIFEVGDVVYLDENNDIGASNKRKLACLCVGNKSHLEDIQGPLTLLFNKCGIKDFSFELKDDTTKYLKNQSAIIKIRGEICGSIGVCSGYLLNKYKIPYSGSMFEIDIEKIFEFQNKI